MLKKSGAAWLASLAFCLVYLSSLLMGAGPLTIIKRASMAALAAFLLGRFLMHPLVEVLFEALAERERKLAEERRRREAQAEEGAER